ncbi:MAG: toxin-antitoxin system HicB family antitoxin [Candidatus Poseidoniaceae archaeon]
MEKKKILLRLDPKLHAALKQWADEEFRSLNSHIEFLLKKTLSSNRRSELDE